MNVAEISECFPNNFKPVTGEFILQHARALSKHCSVLMIVPLRFVPSRELLSYNPFRLISNIAKWFSQMNQTENFTEGNLKVIYFGYISLPRPAFESADNSFINFFFYRKLKNILAEFGPDLIYCNWLRPWAELSGRLAEYFDVPFVIDHHEDIPTLKKIFPGNYKDFLKIFGSADKVIVHSSVNKNQLQEENLKLREIETIYLGQNFSVSGKKKDFNFSKVKIICVSHLNEQRKNIDHLINALALIKNELNFNFKIIGDGVLKNKYINLCKESGIENSVEFTGAKNQDEINDLLDDSDIFVLPSYPEAFGIVFTEALAKGLPVITCKGNGGGEELLRLGYPAVLVKTDSPAELAKAILDLSKDKNKMSLMSETGKGIVKKYFMWSKNGENTFDALKKTLNEFKQKD
jgi:glycosyltransferase involved in cell wall biosynthesis